MNALKSPSLFQHGIARTRGFFHQACVRERVRRLGKCVVVGRAFPQQIDQTNNLKCQVGPV